MSFLSKAAYHAPSIFEEEVETLFNRGFQFVAMTHELACDRDFVCVDHFGAAIVVQNFRGELKAFQNICSHRFNRLQSEDRGHRPLMCSYHGWTYDRTGTPTGIPKREQYRTGDDSSLCLTAYTVETCGVFVFVRMGDGPPLREQLGTFYAALEELSPHIGREIHHGVMPHAANWKLLVENVLECYHCGVVHQQTFIELGIGKRALEDVTMTAGHSSCHFPRVPERREALRQRYLSHLKDRGQTHDSLYHIYIFPNLFISSPEGLSYYVGQLLPKSPGETQLRMRLFEPALDLSDRHRERQGPINAATIATTLAVLEEDRRILENIQSVVRLADKPGRLGAEEVRIAAFHDQYAERMAAS